MDKFPLLEVLRTRSMIFNGKFHIAIGFKGKQCVRFGDQCSLGAFGSSLETGVGLNTQLSSNFVFYGDDLFRRVTLSFLGTYEI
ncbi:hypothetical protein [Bartonella sp. AU55XJBT]|uniref:hypothetical protein n=1 Tax=Bartonella sp. AU55XJBT TaxID=3019091 RepID=UPI002362F5E6|nr:hypothetical protein [Bartonella sp. AU55XJBT]